MALMRASRDVVNNSRESVWSDSQYYIVVQNGIGI